MKKGILITLGTLSLILGLIGIFVPLLPTTPFLLLTAWLYFRSSQYLYQKLITNKYIGGYIRRFREEKAIPLRAKILSITLIWLTIGYCILYVTNLWWLRAVLFIIAISVSWHILSYKTMKRLK